MSGEIDKVRKWLRRLVCRGCFRAGIVPAGTHKCVNHAISVMRLALGYSSGLPSDWYWSGYLLRDGHELFQRAFPKHEVYLFVPDDTVAEFPGATPMSQIKYYHADEHLWAFAYPTGTGHHFVIGMPVVEEGEIQAASVLAVKF